MNILITGIAGHLGSKFAEWVIKNQPDVGIYGIDNFSCGYRENIPKSDKVRMYPGPGTLGQDMRTHELESVISSVDYVFHFAAYAAEGLSPFIRKFDTQNNLLSTIELLNACLNVGTVKRIVFTSSMSVYGDGEPPFAESLPRKPIDAYGISKAACEQHLETAYAQHGQDYCIIRPHNIYGPGQSGWQVFRNVLANWMIRTLEEKKILVYGDGKQQRAFSWVYDCLPCLWNAAVNPEAGQQIINLGGSRAVSIYAAAMICKNITGNEIEFVEQRHEAKLAYCTTQKSIDLLDYQETISLEAGMHIMWDWIQDAWRKYPERRGTHKVTELEVERGLYEFWKEYVR